MTFLFLLYSTRGFDVLYGGIGKSSEVSLRSSEESKNIHEDMEHIFVDIGFYRDCVLVFARSTYLTGRKARIALSTARTVTPTSAKTAIHIVATPSRARSSTSTLMPMANQAF